MKLSLKNPVNWNNHGFHIFHFSELLRHRKKKRERYKEGRKKDFILGILGQGYVIRHVIIIPQVFVYLEAPSKDLSLEKKIFFFAFCTIGRNA